MWSKAFHSVDALTTCQFWPVLPPGVARALDWMWFGLVSTRFMASLIDTGEQVIRHFSDERALNSLRFLAGASVGFLRTSLLQDERRPTWALQRYLGHRNIQHTVRYTDMAPDRFKDFWRG